MRDHKEYRDPDLIELYRATRNLVVDAQDASWPTYSGVVYDVTIRALENMRDQTAATLGGTVVGDSAMLHTCAAIRVARHFRAEYLAGIDDPDGMRRLIEDAIDVIGDRRTRDTTRRAALRWLHAIMFDAVVEATHTQHNLPRIRAEYI
jgi:hypothetical protein